MEALELFVTQPALTNLLGKGPDLSQFSRLIGNIKSLFVGLVLAWVLAAFGEEVVYRGYLMNRVAGILHRNISSLDHQSGHCDNRIRLCARAQGVTGVAENIIDGTILGVLYLATGRNFPRADHCSRRAGHR